MPSIVFDKTTAEELTEKQFTTVIYVEGHLEDDQHKPVGSLEDRFKGALDRGSPELVRGHSYDGCGYDGTFFSCSNPLSSVIKNVRNLFH